MRVLDLLRLKPVTRYAFASTRFGFRHPDLRKCAFVLIAQSARSCRPAANPLELLVKNYLYDLISPNTDKIYNLIGSLNMVNLAK